MDASPLQPAVQKLVEATEDSRLVPSVVLTGHGRLNRIKVTNMPLPRSLKDDHVEVEVYYCGLNFTDNYLRLGIIRNEAFPTIMGSECCGVVTRVGAEVNDLVAGQRVVCLRMQGGLFRHVVQVPRRNCYALPPGVSLTAAIGLALACLVAYVCLLEVGQIRRGAVVFMQSLAGGVGTAVAQVARTVPLVTVLGTAAEDKHERLWRLGVNSVYRHQDNYAERVLTLYPEGADVVIVRSGGAETEKCLGLLKPCGRLISIGSDSTATYPRTKTMALQRPAWDTKYISSAELINKNVMVAGLNIADLIEKHPSDVQMILDRMFHLHFIEKIQPQIHSIIPFEKMADGLEILCRRQNFGKVLLMVQDEKNFASPFGQRVPSPPRAIPGSMSYERLQRRAEMRVLCRRRLKYWPKQTVPEENGEEQEDQEVAQGQEDLDDSMYTEVEASMAAEMIKALSESEADLKASASFS